MYEDITLITCNFNQPILTIYMIKSFYKMNPNFNGKIIIFDNSNKTEPIIVSNSLITTVDNTRSQILNFDNYLNSHQHIDCLSHNGSFKHCMSINYIIKNLVNTKYCLLVDNDILFKTPITELYNKLNQYNIIGYIERFRSWIRIVPFYNFIDAEYLNNNNIEYFDENRMYGINGINLENYDTGTSFLEDLNKLNTPIYKINVDNYIEHLHSTFLNKNIFDFLIKNTTLWN